MGFNKYFFCMSVCILSLCTNGVSYSSDYKARRIDGNPPGIISYATGISNSGIVLGAIGGANPDSYFLWTEAGGMQEFGSSATSFTSSPNSYGQIVGMENSDLGGRYAYVGVVRDTDGTIKKLNYLNLTDNRAEAMAVSDCGVAVGYSGGESSSQPVIWDISNGEPVQIGTCDSNTNVGWAVISGLGYTAWTNISTVISPSPGENGQSSDIFLHTFRRSQSGLVDELISPILDEDCNVLDIADNGRVLISDASGAGYVWNIDGSLTGLPLDKVYAMNDKGQIIGMLSNRDVILNTDGSLSDLLMPDGAISMRIADINDSGTVVGWAAFLSADDVHPIIWQSVPEPPNLLALLGGLAGFGGIAVRKRR